MRTRQVIAVLSCATLLALPATLHAQFTVPNIVTGTGDVVSVLGNNLFINHGLVGAGRIPASNRDVFGESFGSVSGLQITEWTKVGDNYAGTFNILPDRGYNSGTFFSDYAARIQRVNFVFTPHTGGAIGGSDIASKMAAQNQITMTSTPTGVKFQYFDVVRNTLSPTTGLDPNLGFTTLFGATLPYVVSFNGPDAPGGVSTSHTGINKLPIDAEALVLKADGSGYFGDEYGANIYYFNSSKQIVGVVGLPEALRPRRVSGGNYYFGASTPDPIEGRRINQGFEGVALSPDGTRLFVLLQSAAMQDSAAAQTRLLVYDVSGSPTPLAPVAEYALTLPTYRTFGDGGPVNATAAQSEIVALDNQRLLVLSRDGNGLGNATYNSAPNPIGGLPSVFKSVLLVDLKLGSPTNFAGSSRDAEGGKITQSAGVLASGVVPVTTKEVLNLLNSTQLGNFNFVIDAGGTTQVSPLTLSEKWEGMSLVPANDPAHPHHYFLFVANDNDFLTSTGMIQGPNGLTPYDGFSGYAPQRQPANGGDGATNNNDTVFLVFRVTSVHDEDAPVLSGMPTDCSVWPPNHKMVKVATVSASDPLSGLQPGSFVVTAVSDEPGDSDTSIVPDGAAASTCCSARSARRMTRAARTRSPRRRPTWSGTWPQPPRRVLFRTTLGRASSGVSRVAAPHRQPGCGDSACS
jgi:hypothetical protein